MADTKADKALTEANYTIKLILGGDLKHEGKVIDISEPVKKALRYSDVGYPDGFQGHPDVFYGVAYQIIGIREELLEDDVGFGRTEALRTPSSRSSLYQNILAILQASIVNAKQYEAVKLLIDNAFSKDKDEERQGAEYVLAKSTN